MAISDLQRIQIDSKYSAIANTPRGNSVRQMLERRPAIKAVEGKLWLNHLVYHPMSSIVHDLTHWYLWVEDQQGRENAQRTLDLYLESTSVRITLAVWVFGIQPAKVYKFDNISLVPTMEMPDSCERDEYLALMRNHQSPVSYAAFTTEIDVPRVVDDEGAARIVSQKIQRSYDDHTEVASLVNGLNDLSCLPHWSCSYQGAHIPFGPWGCTGKSRQRHDIVGVHSRVFSEGASATLREMIRYYHRMTTSERQWIQAILERIRNSKRQTTIGSKLLDLGIAAEMLLLKDLNENDPVALPFRFRGSWLLGDDSDTRYNIHNTLKEFYGYRCAIAHNGVFKKERDICAAQKKLSYYYEIVEHILQLAIRPTYPRNRDDWLYLILGKPVQHEPESKQGEKDSA